MSAKVKTPAIQDVEVLAGDGDVPEEPTHLEAVPEPDEATAEAEQALTVEQHDVDTTGTGDSVSEEPKPSLASPEAASTEVSPALASPAPPSGGRTRTALRWLMRGLLVAAVVVAGFALWPEFRDRVLDPVEANAADTAAVRDRVDAAEAQVAELEAEAQELRNRIAALESGAVSLGSELEAASARIDDLAPVIDEHTEALALLDEQQAALAGRVDADSVEAAIGIDVVRSMELMSRARLFLYQSNYGLAGEDVRAAREVLQRITEQADAPEVFALAVERLDRVLDNLPDRPVLASDDLDVAWQILLAESRVSALELSSTADTSTSTDSNAGQDGDEARDETDASTGDPDDLENTDE